MQDFSPKIKYLFTIYLIDLQKKRTNIQIYTYNIHTLIGEGLILSPKTTWPRFSTGECSTSDWHRSNLQWNKIVKYIQINKSNCTHELRIYMLQWNPKVGDEYIVFVSLSCHLLTWIAERCIILGKGVHITKSIEPLYQQGDMYWCVFRECLVSVCILCKSYEIRSKMLQRNR